MPDIFKAWHDAGLDAPIVEEMFSGSNPDRTILTLPLGDNYVTSDEVSDEDKKSAILDFCREPRSKAEIQEHLGISSERYIRQKLIIPLLKQGCLVRTIPDKPSSPKQKYVASDK